MSEFGKVLREIRKASGLTQEQAAEYLGFNRPGYAAYEEGRALPSVPNLVYIARKLNIPDAEILPTFFPELFPNPPEPKISEIGNWFFRKIGPLKIIENIETQLATLKESIK